MNKQEFVDKYLNTIISIRKKYFLLEKLLDTATAREIIHIKHKQQVLAEELCRFVLRPQTYMEIKEQKYIEEILSKD